jgi:hypothetical protein
MHAQRAYKYYLQFFGSTKYLFGRCHRGTHCRWIAAHAAAPMPWAHATGGYLEPSIELCRHQSSATAHKPDT